MRSATIVPESRSDKNFVTYSLNKVDKVLSKIAFHYLISKETYDIHDLNILTNALNDWIYIGIKNPTVRRDLKASFHLSTFLNDCYYPELDKYLEKLPIRHSVDTLWFLSSVIDNLPLPLKCRFLVKINEEYKEENNILCLSMLYRCIRHFSLKVDINFYEYLYNLTHKCNGFSAIESALIFGRISPKNKSEFWFDCMDNFAFKIGSLTEKELKLIFVTDKDYWLPRFKMVNHILWSLDNEDDEYSSSDLQNNILKLKRQRSKSIPLSMNL